MKEEVTQEMINEWLEKGYCSTVVEDLIREALGDDKTLVIG